MELFYAALTCILMFFAGMAYGIPSAKDCKGDHTWGKWTENADLVSEIIIKRSCKVCGELQVERRKAVKCSPTSD
jgi:hypothetical protein